MATSTSAITVELGDLAFPAVPLDQASFDDKNAIYVILERDSSGAMTVLDVGESSNAGTSPFNVPLRREAWVQQSKTQDIWVGTYREPTERLFSKAGNAMEDRAKTVERLKREFLGA